MKRFVFLFLSLLLVIGLCACGSKADESKGDSSSKAIDSEIVVSEDDGENSPAPDGTESEELVEESLDAVQESEEISETSVTEEQSAEGNESADAPKAITINGNPIADYVIVYPFIGDLATYEEVAIQLQTYIKDSFGVELAVQGDGKDEVEKEIIVGHSNKRDICKTHDATFGYGGYKLVVEGSKLLIESDYATGCYQGFKALIEQINTADGVLADLTAEGEGKVLKVACAGDSITQGINSTQPKVHNYPRYLQGMLGFDYYVMNAGITDYSICSTDNFAYRDSFQHILAVDFAPDILIFNLGTNDANPAHDYKSWTNPDLDRKAVFKESMNRLLDDYVEANENVQIFVGIPSALFVVDNDKWQAEAWTANIVDYVIPLIKEVATERGLVTADFFEWSLEHPEVYVDGLHPKDETYFDYAQHMYDCIKDSIKKP